MAPMVRTTCLAAAAAALAIALPRARAQNRPDPRAQLAVAESALAHGDMDRAVDLARAYTSHHEGDWRGWYVQGEATLRRGGSDAAYRVAAAIAFRHATKLAPERAEVWDGYGRAGLELGNSDGEVILHEAYERVLALDPLYPGALENWRKAWRNHDDRERMRGILARHDSIPEVRARIAQLLIEDEQYPAADRVLDSLLEQDPRQPEWLALRGQSALEGGDTLVGSYLYGRALVNAGRPGGELLWQQAVGVATPAEIRAWDAGIPDSLRSGFLRSFWARRNPDLFAGVNQRIAEHFARLRVARRMFLATHPLANYKNRASARAMSARATLGEQLFYQRCEAREIPGGPVHLADQAKDFGLPFVPPSAPNVGGAIAPPGGDASGILGMLQAWRAAAPFMHGIEPPGQLFLDPENRPNTRHITELDVPYSRDIRDVDTTAAAIGYNLRTGLDDRGLTLLRFGPPRHRVIGSTNDQDQFCQLPDLERWQYDDIGTVRFFRPEAVNVGALAFGATTGEQVFRPMNEPQFQTMQQAMTRNASSVPAPLGFGVWTAQFAGRLPGATDVAVVSTRGAVAAQLDGPRGEAGPPEEDSTGVVVLRARPGTYALVANAKVADTLGRQSLRLEVRALGDRPGLSDLLLAPAWDDTAVTRGAVLRRVQRELLFAGGTTLRAYAEVYGLTAAADGFASYRASYQIWRTTDPAADAQRDSLPGGVRLAFDRQKPVAGGRVREWLDITPAQVPPGRYLLRIEVATADSAQVVGRAQIGFVIRGE